MCIIRNTEKTSKAVSERRVTKAAQELEQNKLPVLASFLARFWYTVFFSFLGGGRMGSFYRLFNFTIES